jgi:hypothetical protein
LFGKVSYDFGGGVLALYRKRATDLLALTHWFLWKLSTMPHCNNPNDGGFNFIKKTVRRYDHFPVGEAQKEIGFGLKG